MRISAPAELLAMATGFAPSEVRTAWPRLTVLVPNTSAVRRASRVPLLLGRNVLRAFERKSSSINMSSVFLMPRLRCKNWLAARSHLEPITVSFRATELMAKPSHQRPILKNLVGLEVEGAAGGEAPGAQHGVHLELQVVQLLRLQDVAVLVLDLRRIVNRAG